MGAIVAFGLYTAVKASYISTNFAIRVEERNLIYLAPVIFAVTARWAIAGRARPIPVLLSAAAVWYLIDTTPYHNTEHFYSDAPGLSILQWLNRKPFYFTTTDAHRLLLGILFGSVALMMLRELARGRGSLQRLAVPVGALLALAIIGWNLTGEIAAGNASNSFSDSMRGVLPTPPDWIDRATGRARTMYIGQSLGGSNAFWSVEFWNQSISDVWSVDASAPGPGATTTPNYRDLTGAVDPQLPIDWIVATPGVDPAGQLRETVGGLRLFRVHRPIRIADAEGGISTDACLDVDGVLVLPLRPGRTKPGYATVSLSRAAACGGYPPSHMTIKLSSLRIDANEQPAAGRPLRDAAADASLRSVPDEGRAHPRGHAVPDRRDRARNVPAVPVRPAQAERPGRLRLRPAPLERAQPFGVLAHEARDPAPVPERAPRQPAGVGLGLVLVRDDRRRHVPALPAGLHGAVLKVDVLAVEAKALVEPAELLEHRAAQHQEAAEHPVGRHRRLGRRLVEVVVVALPRIDEPKRRAPHDRPEHGREPPPRGLPVPSGNTMRGPATPQLWPRLHEGAAARRRRPRPGRRPGSRRRRAPPSSARRRG